MADAEAGGDGFKALWPTIFMQATLPGHELANQELEKVIRALERDNRALTTDYLEANFLVHEHPAVAWLRECVNKTVVRYFRHLGMTYDIEWTLQGWPNINRFGDYHDYHNHPHAYLSGTYYVRLPEGMEKLETRKDVRPGCITFYDPRYGANMTAIKGDPYIEAEYTVRPEAGQILLWPAFINHFVHPNLSKSLRVSVSFNVVLKWKDEYLPEQV